MKTLISGTGQCGLDLVANELNVKPEQVYKLTSTGKLKYTYSEILLCEQVEDFEVSWFAFPFFPTFKGFKVLVIREPDSCIRNLKKYFLNNPLHAMYVAKLGYDPYEGVEDFYIECNSVLFANCDMVLDMYGYEGGDPSEALKVYQTIVNHKSSIESLKNRIRKE